MVENADCELWIADFGPRRCATRTLVSRVPRVLLCQYGVFICSLFFRVLFYVISMNQSTHNFYQTVLCNMEYIVSTIHNLPSMPMIQLIKCDKSTLSHRRWSCQEFLVYPEKISTRNYGRATCTEQIQIVNAWNFKALSHGVIFRATCNAILLLGDVKLANTCFHHSLPKYF